MNRKLTLLIFLAVLVTAFTIIGGRINSGSLIRWSSHAQTSSPADNFTFEGLAARAQADGQTTVELLTHINEIDVDSFDDALSNYSVLIVQPTAIQSFRSGDQSIETWYKLNVVRTISQRAYVAPCGTCGAPPSAPPSGFPAPAAGEILTTEVGGTLVINGVTFAQSTDLPFFAPSETYVLFVNLNPTNNIATVLGGGFKVMPDGDTLSPLDTSDSPSVIVTGVASRFNNSLSQLRAALQ